MMRRRLPTRPGFFAPSRFRGCLLSLLVAVALAAVARTDGPETYRGWATYGGDAGQRRYSALAQITRANVARLEVAWTYDSGETGGLQTNPIVVDGVLYTTTPTHRVVALDAATGVVRWTFASGIEGRGPNRGVTYWPGADREPPRIFTAQGAYLYALDARTGEGVASFGRDGRIDLRDGLGRDAATQSVALTTPGVVYDDLIIVGGRVSEGLPASPGDIRAFDVRTGAPRWSFHTIPHPGELGHDTWPADAWTYIGGANNWAGMALDEARGIVFVPTGSAASDFYGANRIGDNLFANALLALDATNGTRLWHFQSVRHDIWDRDFPSPPSLVTVTREGRAIDAVAQTSKQGWLYVFDRTSGTSLFPVDDRRFPESDVDGERAARTQPVPRAPAPFARQLLTESLLTMRTPAAHEAAVAAFRGFRSEGQFVPLDVGRPTVVFPGFDGGAEWGGSAFDPETGLLYVNANEMAWTGALAPVERGTGGRSLYLRECATCHRDDLRGAPPQIPSLVDLGSRRTRDELSRVIRQGAGRMPAFPRLSDDALAAVVEFLRTGQTLEATPAEPSPIDLAYRFTGYRKFLDPDGYPAIAPPWGTLNAIDVSTGRHVWTVPLGEYPELAARGVKNTGSENYGGPIVTAGGLVFIGATSFDRKVRAFDKATGALRWEAMLPFSATGTPATYEVDGRQFVVVPAGGGKSRPPPSGFEGPFPPDSGGRYVAFALR
jgi:quinoprotein glucose dehydrogenase